MDKSRTYSALAPISTVLPRALIRLYQLLTLGVAPRCRFSPTCSEYFYQVLNERGLWRGITQGMVRLLKCHPWHSGGYDPIRQQRPGTF